MWFLLLLSLNVFAQDERSEYKVEYGKGNFCQFAEMKLHKVASTMCLWQYTNCGKIESKSCCWENRKGKFEYKKHVVFDYKYCVDKK